MYASDELESIIWLRRILTAPSSPILSSYVVVFPTSASSFAIMRHSASGGLAKVRGLVILLREERCKVPGLTQFRRM